MIDFGKLICITPGETTLPINVMNFTMPTSPTAEESVSDLDVNRTAKQHNKLVSYDIGRVAGSRKELAALKKMYLERKDRASLDEIAAVDDVLADELANKKNVFDWFSMIACKDNGVEVEAAYGMHLLIRRLPADSKGIGRDAYMNAIELISEEFKTVKTLDELMILIDRLKVLALSKSNLDDYDGIIARNIGVVSKEKLIQLYTGMATTIANYNEVYCIGKLGSFAEFLKSSTKVRTWFKSLLKYKSWDDYEKKFAEATQEKKVTKPKVKKSVWERELPINPTRISDVPVPTIMIPEDYVRAFKFRANQMGHWMKDEDALGHLRNSASGFADLAYLLDWPLETISLGNELAMAFGARGSGRALAHFERGKHRNVINMTKTKGSLGVLAHEFAHAMDYRLRVLMGDGNPLNELLTEVKNLDVIEDGMLALALQKLKASFLEGTCTGYHLITNELKTAPNFQSRMKFASCDYDMQTFVDSQMFTFDEQVDKLLAGYFNAEYREKTRVKYARKRAARLKSVCHLAAELHYDHTGEYVEEVPYTIHHSRFYQLSLMYDGGKKSKPYWASDVELFARAFEAYINEKLKQKGMQNDYLVCGVDGGPYPIGDELTRISEAFDHFMKVVRPYLV